MEVGFWTCLVRVEVEVEVDSAKTLRCGLSDYVRMTGLRLLVVVVWRRQIERFY